MKTLKRTLFPLLALVTVTGTGCGKDSSFSLLEETDNFVQSTSSNSKIDILWVIDNSGSMQTSQQNVINNLDAFIADFATRNLDFKMAVTTTDGYRSLYTSNPNCARFRDGILNASCNTVSGATYSGIRVMDKNTPNIESVFLTNALQTIGGVYGSGDERAFQSMQTSLNSSLNAGFVRPDSFLSVIIVSDEEDSSRSVASGSAPLHTLQTYVDYLDSLTTSDPINRRYNVNGMVIKDSACRTQLGGSDRDIAQRVMDLVDLVNTGHAVPAANGKKTSLCSTNFSDDLADIATGILVGASEFKLDRIPIPSTIVITVNGVLVEEESVSSSGEGWTYVEATNSIFFSSGVVIPAGASISVNYDPANYGS